MQNFRPHLEPALSRDAIDVSEAVPETMDSGLEKPHCFLPLRCVDIIIRDLLFDGEDMWRALIFIIRGRKNVQ